MIFNMSMSVIHNTIPRIISNNIRRQVTILMEITGIDYKQTFSSLSKYSLRKAIGLSGLEVHS